MWNNKTSVLDFRLLKVVSLCFIGIAAKPRPSLNELHGVVVWNGFHFKSEPCLGSGVEVLTFSWDWERQFYRAGVRSVRSWKTSLTSHIIARTNQLNKEKQESIMTVRTELPVSLENYKIFERVPKWWICLTWAPSQEKTKNHLC